MLTEAIGCSGKWIIINTFSTDILSKCILCGLRGIRLPLYCCTRCPYIYAILFDQFLPKNSLMQLDLSLLFCHWVRKTYPMTKGKVGNACMC